MIRVKHINHEKGYSLQEPHGMKCLLYTDGGILAEYVVEVKIGRGDIFHH